ncbi:MAG TPA: MBL fold metallo-hydrolase [Spirochaetota bacterium]|nr:MBL fold metallo-hydrolase [Spirochaetota bacterium]HPF07502.1 MBL fold metallo-hydrolase [Spirochaetota bacterium]HPJ40736.1 MBL fold metallo-hydrolase [Spirochaetota bacterium]HRX45919.1 MBL fold metallo-hydrolase [Spirochaetota bacterium]
MKQIKKVLFAAAGIVMTVSLVYGINDENDKLFDENSWRESVNNVDRSLFYAPHYKDGEFFNPWMKMDRKSFFTVLKWRFFSEKKLYTADEESFLPDVKTITAEYINSNDNFVSWIGHASILLKTSGKILLIDPVLGEIPFVKKRRTQAALNYEEAAKINGDVIILLTHNHYDHLDKKSIKSFPENARFIVPLGLSDEIKNMRGEELIVKELDWWNEIIIDDVKITFLPSQHWSRRLFSDVNSSLWGSYLIDTDGKKIFICGDTGYSGLFKEFGKKFKSIDYAFISTGAFHPRWFMHYAHQDVSEAVQAFLDLGAKKMIPIHWGAFRLGEEPEGYLPIHLKKKLPEALILNPGEIIPLNK